MTIILWPTSSCLPNVFYSVSRSCEIVKKVKKAFINVLYSSKLHTVIDLQFQAFIFDVRLLIFHNILAKDKPVSQVDNTVYSI